MYIVSFVKISLNKNKKNLVSNDVNEITLNSILSFTLVSLHDVHYSVKFLFLKEELDDQFHLFELIHYEMEFRKEMIFVKK